MSGEQLQTPVALCETCWLKDHARWEPESMSDGGDILMRLTGVDVPIKVNTGSVEVCTSCGRITVAGIFELQDPKVVFFTTDNTSTHSLTSLIEREEGEEI
jgi:hypothetical protein